MTEEQITRLLGDVGEIRRASLATDQRTMAMEQRLNVIESRLGLIEQRLSSIEQWVPVDHRHLQVAMA